jgi:hypothetical protein
MVLVLEYYVLSLTYESQVLILKFFKKSAEVIAFNIHPASPDFLCLSTQGKMGTFPSPSHTELFSLLVSLLRSLY